MASANKKSLIGSKGTVDVSITKVDGKAFTIHVTKDDFSWEVVRYYSEFVFFRKTILEVANKLKNEFPKYTDDNKDMLDGRIIVDMRGIEIENCFIFIFI